MARHAKRPLYGCFPADVDGLPPFGGAFLLSDFVDEGGSSRRYLEFGGLSQAEDDLTIGLRAGATIEVEGVSSTVRSTHVVQGRNRVIFDEASELSFQQGDAYRFTIHFVSASRVQEYLFDQIHAAVTSDQLRAGESERMKAATFGDTRVGQHFSVAPEGLGEAVVYRSHHVWAPGVRTQSVVWGGLRTEARDGIETAGNPISGHDYPVFSNYSSVKEVRVLSLGWGYTAPTLVFEAPQHPTGTRATGTPQIDQYGRITSVTITEAGSGYDRAPHVTLTDADGQAAQLLVVMTGGASLPKDLPANLMENGQRAELLNSNLALIGTDVPYFSFNTEHQIEGWRNYGMWLRFRTKDGTDGSSRASSPGAGLRLPVRERHNWRPLLGARVELAQVAGAARE